MITKLLVTGDLYYNNGRRREVSELWAEFIVACRLVQTVHVMVRSLVSGVCWEEMGGEAASNYTSIP